MKKALTFLTLLFFALNINAQYIPYTLEEKVLGAELVVEAEIIEKFTYERDGRIYTANKIDICDFIIGNSDAESSNEFFVITWGGEFDGKFDHYSHSIQLNLNDFGMFFLKPASENQPENHESNQSFYYVHTAEQGFITYQQDDLGNFEGSAINVEISDVDALINQIGLIAEQTTISTSCILESKNEIVVSVDTAIIENSGANFYTSIKGLWSKSFELEEISIKVSFINPIDLNEIDLQIIPQDIDIENNYSIAVTQLENTSINISLNKTSTTDGFSTLEEEYSDFLVFNFGDIGILYEITELQVLQASFNSGNSVSSFTKTYVSHNLNLNDSNSGGEAAVITSFTNPVAAGTHVDITVGTPSFPGTIIIKGSGFGDIPKADFVDKIPINRVEFTREESGGDFGQSKFRISPLLEDYIYWTDTEIKVNVPTCGHLSEERIFVGSVLDGGVDCKVAISGPIHVILEGNGNDVSSDSDLTVTFAHFNKDVDLGIRSIPNKLANSWVSPPNSGLPSGNGGYFLLFAPSFNSIYSDIAAAKKDVKDAFCEWNDKTEVVMEVDNCPLESTAFSGICKKIEYIDLSGITSFNSTTLARGLSQFDAECPDERSVRHINLSFNNEITDWTPSTVSSFSTHIIKPATYHEVGHLHQLGHVNNDGATMHPLYSNSIMIDDYAKGGGTHVAQVSTSVSCNLHIPTVLGDLNCVSTSSITFKEQFSVIISPNPFSNYLKIIRNENFERKANLSIFDQNGKIILSKKLDSNISEEINVKDLISGIYYLHLSSDSEKIVYKFIKHEN